MARKISYTILRGNTYHFKLRVDHRLKQVPAFSNLDFIQFSLKTKDSRIAFEQAARHHAEIMKQLADFERRGHTSSAVVTSYRHSARRPLDNEAIMAEVKRFEDRFFHRLSFDQDHVLEQYEGRSDYGYVAGRMIEAWQERQKELADPYNDETVWKAERVIRDGSYELSGDADLVLAGALAEAEASCIEKLLNYTHHDRLKLRLASLSDDAPALKNVTIGEVIQNYRDRHPENEAMLKKLEPALSAWRQLIGTEQASKISGTTVREFAFALAKVPARYRDRFPGMLLPDAIIANVRRAEPFPTLAVKTIRDGYIGPLKTAFSTAKKDALIPVNPFGDAAVPSVGRSMPRRRSFRPHELNMIFQHPIWTGCSSSLARNTPGDLILRDHYFWPALISLFSGMRAGEIADFAITDIKLDHPTPHFDARGTKTKNAIRLIPIHPMLIDIGFARYVRDLSKHGHTRLFPFWPKPNGKSRSCGACQRNFNEHVIDTEKFDRPKPSFHAFRKTIRTVMERRGMPEGYRKILLGHSLDGMDQHYLDPDLSDYRDRFIAAVQYDELDLSHLVEKEEQNPLGHLVRK